MVKRFYEGYGKMTQRPKNKFDAVESYRARFNGLAYEFIEAKGKDERKGSWDSDRDLNTATERVNSILDEYNHFKMGKEVDVVEIPDFVPDELVYTSEEVEPLDGRGTD